MQKLRMTMIKDYETCPYLCKVNWGAIGDLGKVDNEGSTTNKYAEFGIIFHEVMEQHALAKMEGNIIPLSKLHEMLDERLLAFDMELLDKPEEFEEWRSSLHEQLDWGHHNACIDHTNVIGAEVSFDLDNLIEGCIPFTGTMDRIVGDLSKKEVVIEDWKTGRPYTRNEMKTNVQATVYSLAFYRMFGFLPKEFVFYFTKNKKIKTIQITPDFLEAGTTRILENWYKMNNGEWNPDTSNKFFCKNFCSINKECVTQRKVEKEGWESVK